MGYAQIFLGGGMGLWEGVPSSVPSFILLLSPRCHWALGWMCWCVRACEMHAQLHLHILAPLKCVQGAGGCLDGKLLLWFICTVLPLVGSKHLKKVLLMRQLLHWLLPECPQHKKICEKELLRMWPLKLLYSLNNPNSFFLRDREDLPNELQCTRLGSDRAVACLCSIDTYSLAMLFCLF